MRPQDVPVTDPDDVIAAGDVVRANALAHQDRVFSNEQRASFAVVIYPADDNGIVRLMWECDGYQSSCHSDWIEKDEKLSAIGKK